MSDVTRIDLDFLRFDLEREIQRFRCKTFGRGPIFIERQLITTLEKSLALVAAVKGVAEERQSGASWERLLEDFQEKLDAKKEEVAEAWCAFDEAQEEQAEAERRLERLERVCYSVMHALGRHDTVVWIKPPHCAEDVRLSAWKRLNAALSGCEEETEDQMEDDA